MVGGENSHGGILMGLKKMLKKMKKLTEDRSILNKRKGAEKIVFGIVCVLFAVYAISLIYPLLWLVVNSFKSSKDYGLDFDPFALPKYGWQFTNYIQAFVELRHDGTGTTFVGMFINSIWTGVGAALISAFFHACTGYVFAKYNFKMKAIMYFLVIFSLTVPIVGAMAATYKLKIALGLYDNPLAIAITNASGFGGNFLVMYALFKGISWTYAEAVYIDGGNDFVVFFKIMLPQALPAIVTLFIQSVITHWKEYTNILMYLPSYPTLATGLYLVQNLAGMQVIYPVYYAGLVLSVIPIVALYAFSASAMMKNLSVGGIKG